jgi:hypothetical protein
MLFIVKTTQNTQIQSVDKEHRFSTLKQAVHTEPQGLKGLDLFRGGGGGIQLYKNLTCHNHLMSNNFHLFLKILTSCCSNFLHSFALPN